MVAGAGVWRCVAGCGVEGSASLKTDMVKLMNDYFDDVSVNGYQAQDYSWAADGNYFGGHLLSLYLIPLLFGGAAVQRMRVNDREARRAPTSGRID